MAALPPSQRQRMLRVLVFLFVFAIATAPLSTLAFPIPPNYADLTAPEETTTDCWLEEALEQGSSFFGGNRPLLKCHWTNRIMSAYDDDTTPDLYMDWNVTVTCPSRRNRTPNDFPTAVSMRLQAFELWNEDECTCEVNEVTKVQKDQVTGQVQEIDIEMCSCTMCPYGYGKSNIILDCSTNATSTATTDTQGIQVQTGLNNNNNLDYYLLDNCTSFDCNHACNGDCGLTCSNAGPECCLCRDDCPEPTQAPATTVPTAAPGTSSLGQGPTTTLNDVVNGDFTSTQKSAAAARNMGKWLPDWLVSLGAISSAVLWSLIGWL